MLGRLGKIGVWLIIAVLTATGSLIGAGVAGAVALVSGGLLMVTLPTMPVVILAAGIILILGFVLDMFKDYLGDAIKEVFEAFSKIGDAFNSAIEACGRAFSWVGDFLGGIGDFFSDLFAQDIEVLYVGNTVDSKKQFFTGEINNVKIISDVLNNSLKYKDKCFDILSAYELIVLKDQEFYSNVEDNKEISLNYAYIDEIANSLKNDKLNELLINNCQNDEIAKSTIVASQLTKSIVYKSAIKPLLKEDDKNKEYVLNAVFPLPKDTKNYRFPSESDFLNKDLTEDNTGVGSYTIYTDKNSEILAPQDSVVESIGWDGKDGFTITLINKTGDIRYYFKNIDHYAEDLARFNTKLNNVLSQNIVIKEGQVIAYVGSTGGTTFGCSNFQKPAIRGNIYVKINFYKDVFTKNMKNKFYPANGYLIMSILENNKK